LVALALTLTSGCGDAGQEQKQKAPLTAEQAFYAKYPYHYVEGLKSKVGPAPFGDAQSVAEAAIRYSKHPCPTVTGAVRNAIDGSVTAKCSNGERYNVSKVEAIKEPIALRCSKLKELMDFELKTCGAI
jgi:hypothetical protein